MNIPGFTASTSLYNTGGRYRASANRPGTSANTGAVLPQLQRQLELLLCLQNCGSAGADPACANTCYLMDHIRSSDDFQSGEGPVPLGSTGGGETGETNSRCRPQCGRCIRDPGSKTGRSKFCVTADCKSRTVSC